MNSIFVALTDGHKIRRFLFWYWLLIPFALFAWIGLAAVNSNSTFQEAIKIPFFAVAFLNGCLSILLAGLFKLAGSENARTERVFTLYTLIIQILVGNLPGALGSYLFLRATLGEDDGERFAPTYRWVMILAMAFLALVSLLILVANLRLWVG